MPVRDCRVGRRADTRAASSALRTVGRGTAAGPGRRARAAAAEPRLAHLQGHDPDRRARSSSSTRASNLAYGFNHAEAGRAFAEAARLDPSCAMAYWGQALVLGPNINAAMNPDDEPKALELVEKACRSARGRRSASATTSTRSRKRYTGKADDRAAADRAFADAMRASREEVSRAISTRRRSSPNR